MSTVNSRESPRLMSGRIIKLKPVDMHIETAKKSSPQTTPASAPITPPSIASTEPVFF